MTAALKRVAVCLLIVFVGMIHSGCATAPYVYGKKAAYPGALPLRPDEPQIESGRRILVVDVMGNVLSIPSKILLLNWHVDCHNITPPTVEALKVYLQENELSEVKIRVNEYAPGGEWSRLFRNKSVGAGWRYTFGILTAAIYTIMPGRLFGGDNYDPFTDTINLYSDHKAIAVHEAGHAKDFARRTYKGTYAMSGMVPLVSLYCEGIATGDAFGYLRAKEYRQNEKDAYKVLYPAYFTYIGGEIANFYPGPEGDLIALGAVVPGHILGRIKAATVHDQSATAKPAAKDTAKK